MSINISTTYLAFLPLVSRVSSNARVLALPMIDFLLDGQYVIDLTAAVQSAQLQHGLQALYCDASDCLYSSTTIQVSGTGQRIRVAPATQGYYPILCTSTSYIFTINNTAPSSAGSNTASFWLYFMNVPFVASQWQTVLPVNIPGGYGTGGLGEVPLGS